MKHVLISKGPQLQVSLSLDVATYGLQSGVAQAALVQTPGSQGATAMLNNNLAGESIATSGYPAAALLEGWPRLQALSPGRRLDPVKCFKK